MHSATRRGLTLSVASAFCGAANLVFYKAAGAGASRQAVVLVALIWAALFNTAAAVGWRRRALPRDLLSILVAVGLGVLTLLANLAVIRALAVLDPALTSVMTHTQVLFVTLIGWVLLRERVTIRFALGIALALAGIAVMRLPGSLSLDAALITAASAPGIGWALAAALTWSLMQVISRKVSHRIDPISVNTLRLWSAVAMVACVPGTLHAGATLGPRIWLLAAGAALAGPFLARTLLMYAVRHIPASQSTAMTLVGPVFTFILGFLVFGTTPSRIEIIGGGIVLTGIALPLADLARTQHDAVAN